MPVQPTPSTRVARALGVALALLLWPCAATAAPSAATTPQQVVFVIGQRSYHNGAQAVPMDAAPFIHNSRALVPVRFLAEALGVPDSGIAWDHGTQTVTLTAGGVVIQMTVGSTTLTINGTPSTMDVGPVLAADNHTYLPARYVAQAFGYQASWDGSNQAVILTNTAALKRFTDGNYVGVTLAFNEVCFGAAGQVPTPPAFDNHGATLDPTDPVWPNAAGETRIAAAQNVPVWFPDTGGNQHLVPSCVNVGREEGGAFTAPVPQDRYRAMYLLEAGGNANLPLDLTLDYTDGTKDTAILPVDDWCAQTPVGAVVAFMAADRMGSIGNKEAPSCGVFLMTVLIPGTTKDLQDVRFALDPNDTPNFEPNILAMTLQKG